MSFSATQSVQEAFESKAALLPYSPRTVTRIRKATHIMENFAIFYRIYLIRQKMNLQVVVILNSCATEYILQRAYASCHRINQLLLRISSLKSREQHRTTGTTSNKKASAERVQEEIRH